MRRGSGGGRSSRVAARWRPLRLAGVAPVALLGALALSGCQPGSEADAEIRMLDNSFDPPAIEIRAGDTIRFVNEGRVPHNAVDAGGAWSTQESFGELLVPSTEMAEVTIDEPGTYTFICTIHSTRQDDGSYRGMVGTVEVGAAREGARSAVPTGSRAPGEWTGVTRSVPTDHATIQAGVDAADPGDLVLVAPGTYRESVTVTTPGVVIRGADRNRVVLDGELTRENGIVVTADGVAIENLTIRNYTVNGVFWNGVAGYRASYLTAIDDWVYGIYAFDSVDGLFEHSYASGAYDAGFYIGQCDPCDAVVTDVLAEYNGLGYSGTNASENLWIVDSEWRHNVAGVVPNTLDSELLPPVHGVVVAGNYVHHNGEDGPAPNGATEWSGYGNGIILAGARDSTVRDNLIVNNRTSGVLVVSMIDRHLWPSGGNRVVDNVIRGSGRSDLAMGGPWEEGSCFEGNEAGSSVPALLTALHACDGVNLPMPWGMAATSNNLGRLAEARFGLNPRLAHGEAPDPPLTFEQLPGGAGAPVVPAVDVFAAHAPRPDGITTPSLPAGVEIDDRRPVVLGVAVTAGTWPVVMGALLWWIPVLVWVLGGLWALLRIWREPDRRLVARVLWTTVVTLVPMVGVVVFALAGDLVERPGRRWLTAGGGTLLWLAAIAGALAAGGIL